MTSTADSAQAVHEDGLKDTPNSSSCEDVVRRVIVAHGMKLAAARNGDLSSQDPPTVQDSFASFVDAALNPETVTTPSNANNGQLLVPLPTASMASSEEEPVMGLDWDNLPPELASADLSMANDNSFVETSSGVAARELKRRFDQCLGVGKDVRSPYAITAFVNQHGKQMFRVGARDMSAPAANMEENELPTFPRVSRSTSVGVTPIASTSATQPPLPFPSAPPAHKARRPRMSVHSFFPPVFKNGTSPPVSVPSKHVPRDGTRSPPMRKLRKTRSIPNMSSPTPLPEPVPAAVVPPAPTGRPHAHSVSSADAWPPPPRSVPVSEVPAPVAQQDTFAEVVFKSAPSTGPPSPMGFPTSLRATRSFHSPVDQTFNGFPPGQANITFPFGPDIEFDAPGWQSPSHLTSGPPLREMQSFESGLTARADPQPRSSLLGKVRARLSDEELLPSEEQAASDPATPTGTPAYEPTIETSMHSRYSTDLFDVLQNYKGLPVLERFNAAPHPTTIRLSLRDQETAVPRDDPRFVIWGELRTNELGEHSPARTSATDLSSGHSVLSRRKSGKDKSIGADAPYVRVSEGPKKVLVAATIERWIAQLTSELNYDELLIFFLTYRTYISALDLGHLLICRFHWALGQPISSHDETVRRIVRLRTFIAIRYWLLTFFSVDFVPNRELRLLFANWINSLRKDPILTRHKDAPFIVQKLRKVVLECKNSHTRSRESKRDSLKKAPNSTPTPAPSSAAVPVPAPTPAPSPSPAPATGHSANRNVGDSPKKAEEPEDDIDLDFEDVDTPGVDFGLGSTNLATGPVNSVDLAMLRQPLHLAYLQYGKHTQTSALGSAVPAQVPLPVPHSTLSRVVVNAIGRLGRWRRVLNYRTTNARAPLRPPLGLGGAACVDASAFDVEASEIGDVLLVNGGVEQYLKLRERRTKNMRSVDGVEDGQLPSELPPRYKQHSEDNMRQSIAYSEQESILESVQETSEEGSTTEEAVAPDRPASQSPSTLLSTPQPTSAQPRDSVSTTESAESSQWQVDVVSIDDLDLSDLSSTEDSSAPAPGLRRLPRRLPNRRDFELVRHSVDSVSSLGTRAHDSVLSGGSSVVSSISVSGGAEPGPIQAGPIQAWQMSALMDSLSDDDEAGDVEAALRRLEGQINQDKQRAKQTKVDGWVQSIRERLATGQLTAEPERYSSDEEDYGEVQESRFLHEDGSASRSSIPWASSSRINSRNSGASVRSPVSAVHSVLEEEEPEVPAFPPGLDSAVAPVKSEQVVQAAQAPPPVESKPVTEDGNVIHREEQPPPAERVRSRASSRPSTFAGSPPVSPPPLPLLPLNTNPTGDPRLFTPPEKKFSKHRSFILSHKSEVLCQHLAMVDRELFLNLKFEELVSQDFVNATDDLNVLDWAQFLRERARMKAEGMKTSDLTLIRSRFNLMANFVTSEIVLTNPGDRLMIYSKFIRIAWKAYSTKSFNTLVAVLAGLSSHWVKKALQQAGAKPGIWESRMLRDLQQWSTSDDDFKHIRQTVEALSEAKSVVDASQESSVSGGDPQVTNSSRSRAASDLKPPPPPACVPFFGVYLSQLHRFSVLPDLIDPTAPTEPVGIDRETNAFDPPAHPEVFANLAPLPPSVQLEPLINVHKQRLIAGVVKSFVAAQHLAIKVQYPTDKKLFQKCLKLRGLDDDTLQRALAVYSGSDS